MSGEEAAQVESAPRSKDHAVALDERERAVAVELGLVLPLRRGGRPVAQLREHRRELGRQRLGPSRRRELCGGDAAPGRASLERVDGHAGQDRLAARGDVAGVDEPVLVLDQQPALAIRRSHQRERALELHAAQEDAELPLLQAGEHAALGLGAVVEEVLPALVRGIRAAIPDDHLARPVLLLRNHALERGVLERVVLGRNGKPLVGGIQRWALRHRPRFEHAPGLEAEVEVQAAGGVLLDDEEQRPRPVGRRRRLGLGRRLEGALGGVLLQRFRECAPVPRLRPAPWRLAGLHRAALAGPRAASQSPAKRAANLGPAASSSCLK